MHAPSYNTSWFGKINRESRFILFATNSCDIASNCINCTKITNVYVIIKSSKISIMQGLDIICFDDICKARTWLKQQTNTGKKEIFGNHRCFVNDEYRFMFLGANSTIRYLIITDVLPNW